MKLYLSKYRQNESNTEYPEECEIKEFNDLKRAVRKDHIAAAMENNHRANGNFLQADCIMLDLDNTHSDDSADWKTIDDISEAFPEVTFYYIQSRNHMKTKVKTAKDGSKTYYEARPKYHCYFPLEKTYTTRAEYEALLLKAAGIFPYFDLGAAKPAQFFFGVENPAGGAEQGNLYLNQFIENQSAENITAAVKDFESKMNAGTFKQNDENKKAINRLYSCLGIARENETATQRGINTTIPAITQSDVEYSQLGYAIAESEQRQRLEWLQKWARQHDVKLGRIYRIKSREHPAAICVCVPCPWEDEHSMNGADNETVIIIELGGKLDFLCRHSHGYKYHWKDYRAYYENQTQDAADGQNLADIEKDDKIPGGNHKTQETALNAPEQQETDFLSSFLESVQTEQYKPYKTELAFFDDLLGGGVIRQTLLLLLAAPAAGKTTICQQIAERMAEHGKPVIYLNLEMSREQMTAKAISSRITRKGKKTSDGKTFTALDVLQGYKWTDDDRAAVNEAVKEYREKTATHLTYNPDGASSDLNEIADYLKNVGERAKAAGEEAPVIILDYLHLITSKQGLDVQELIKQSVITLKQYAIDFNTFAVGIVATNRESSKAGRITLESGRDSSNIEYTADYQLSLQYYAIDKQLIKQSETEILAALQREPWRNMIVRVLKSRFGVQGKFAKVYFNAAGGIFYGENDYMPADPARISFKGLAKHINEIRQTINDEEDNPFINVSCSNQDDNNEGETVGESLRERARREAMKKKPV